MLYNPRQDQVGRDILAAADIIKRDGWRQQRLWGEFGNHDKSVCAKGALIIAITGKRASYVTDPAHRERLLNAVRHLEKHIGLHPENSYGLDLETPDMNITAIPMWNDDPVRTKEEVIGVMCESVGVSEEVLV